MIPHLNPLFPAASWRLNIGYRIGFYPSRSKQYPTKDPSKIHEACLILWSISWRNCLSDFLMTDPSRSLRLVKSRNRRAGSQPLTPKNPIRIYLQDHLMFWNMPFRSPNILSQKKINTSWRNGNIGFYSGRYPQIRYCALPRSGGLRWGDEVPKHCFL